MGPIFSNEYRNASKPAHIRTAVETDVHNLTELAIRTYTEAFGDSMEPDELFAYIERNLSNFQIEVYIQNDVMLIAEYEGRMVGYIHFGDLEIAVGTPPAESKELKRLYVLRENQNQGIGTALMKAALEHPLLRETEAIYLDVWEHNRGAQRLYERFGFRKVEQYRYRFPSGSEGDWEYIMVRKAKGDQKP